MKTILTLKTSSMFFLGSVNLYKGIPAQVDTDDLTVSTVRMVNQAISSGRIESSEGVLTVEEAERGETAVVLAIDESPVVEDEAEKIVSEPEPTVEETVAEPEVEAKPAPKKKTTVAKKKAE